VARDWVSASSLCGFCNSSQYIRRRQPAYKPLSQPHRAHP
jgi:hypothetical protein